MNIEWLHELGGWIVGTYSLGHCPPSCPVAPSIIRRSTPKLDQIGTVPANWAAVGLESAVRRSFIGKIGRMEPGPGARSLGSPR
jgi:hypothetical protein